MVVGYARVSSVDQDTSLQIAAFQRAGITRIYQEKRSGVGSRPELVRVFYMLRRGDVLTVYKVDRLARSLSDLLSILSRLEALGVGFRSLTEPIDTSSPVGRMMLQILGAFAEFERSMIRERCAAGRASALARGVRIGRPPKICDAMLVRLVGDGLSSRQIALHFSCDGSSVRHAIRRLRSSGVLGPSIG